jgi:hypothetical protein
MSNRPGNSVRPPKADDVKGTDGGRRNRRIPHDQQLDTTVMSVFTSTDEPPEKLLRVLGQLLRTVGLTTTHKGDVKRGSWFRSWRLRESRAGALKRLARLAERAERAGELKYIYGARAASDEHEANAVAAVVRSLDGVDSAVIQLSSIVIVKVEDKIICRVLSEVELRIIHDHPELLRSPSELLDVLSKMVDNNRKGLFEGPYPPMLRKGPDEDDDHVNKYDEGLDLFDEVPPAYPPVFGA